MQTIIALSVALVAVAFLVLVIFLAKTLKSLQGTLASVSDTLKGVEKQLDGVTRETTLLLQKTNDLADDIKQKSASLNSVVDAVKGVGVTVSEFNGTLQNITTTVDRQVEESKEKVSQIIQWGNVLWELKDKWQERKAKKEAGLHGKQKIRSH